MTLLRLENIQHLFDQRGIHGLRGIDLAVKKGEIVALMGPSGSGKTTILKVIAKEIEPQMGSRHFQGKVALITRTSHLNHQLSVLENLLAQHHDLDLARYWLDELNISGKINSRPDQLSGGEYQRALLAKTLMPGPELLLVDEAVEQLDPILRPELLNILRQLVQKNNMSVLWVTHLWPEASQFADRVAIIQYGKIIQVGGPSTLYFTPCSPFVAEFTGLTNFQTWKRQSGNARETIFDTPFGVITLDRPWQREDALAMIRPHALRITSNGIHQAKLVKQEFSNNRFLYHLKIDHQHTVCTYHDAKFNTGEKLAFDLDYQQVLIF